MLEIRLDAQEIMERVDDMLAWEAISCAGTNALDVSPGGLRHAHDNKIGAEE